MRRPLACLLILTAACGRIGFDLHSDATNSGDGAGDAAPDPSLLAWYPMDDDPSDGAVDASGHGRHAACGAETMCPSTMPGRIGSAFGFDGSGYLRIPHDPGVDGLGAFTIALWMRVSLVSAAGYTGVGRTVGSTVENSWDLGTYSGNVPAFCSSADGNSNSCDLAVSPAPVNSWFHLAATWDGATKRLFVNGDAREFGPRMILFDTHDITIGCDDENGSLFSCLDGAIDDVRIYDRMLSGAEIRALTP
jgi:hypothetical protein